MLGSNKIRSIPVPLGSIKSLCCLDLSHNSDITKLPNELGNLSSLYVLRLDGLTKLSIDASVLNGTARTIVNFLEARLHQVWLVNTVLLYDGGYYRVSVTTR